MESQTLGPHLKIQLSSNETQTERNKERWNKSAGGRGGKRMGEVWGDTAGGGGQKKINDFTPVFEKGKCMVSEEMCSTFRCPGAFLSCAEPITK